MTRFFTWVPRFTCTRPLWCPFCYTLPKLGHYFRVTKKRWRHSTWSANAKSCTYTGLSMSETQKYPLAPAYHRFITRRRLSVFGHIARLTQGTPAHNALHCQVGLASGCSLGRNWRRRPGCPRTRWTDQLHNDTGSVPVNLWRQAILLGHGRVMRRPELATQWRRCRRRVCYQ